MTQRATARRGARPLVLLACTLLALCTASCAVLYGGSSGMNPQHAEALRRADQMESIEAFQRDIEPALIAARNELLTSDNIRTYSGGDHITSIPYADQHLYAMMSRHYWFEERDVDKVRSTINSHLEPLGFTMMEKEEHTADGDTHANFYWTNARYGATVSVLVGQVMNSSYFYYTAPLRSDGSADDPKKLFDTPGRTPDWFDPNTVPERQ